MTTDTYVVNSTTGKATITKDPNAILDYSFDWTAWLSSASTPADTIASQTCTPAGGVTVQSSNFSNGVVTAWVSGGAVGTEGSVTCRIVTAGGRTDERTIYFKIKDR